jgi:cytochrome b
MGYLVGLVLCFGTPGLIAVLVLSGMVPGGRQEPEGVHQQVGYFLTGLVFLSAAWVWWRSGRMLGDFKDLPEAERSAKVLRETLLYAGIFEISSICGLIYWMFVGHHAARHVWGFILLTPLLFLTLVPRYDRWVKHLEG